MTLEAVAAGHPSREPVAAGSSAPTLISQFQVLAEAAGGSAGLRKIILNLAICGRLSRAEPEDDPVAALLASAENDRLAKLARGDARQMEELGAVASNEAPFALPRAWAWTRVGHAMNLVNGRAFKPKDWGPTGLPIVRIQNLNNAGAPFNHCAFDVEPKHILRPGDFLISWSGTPGTSFGAFIWNGPKGVLNQHIFRAEIYANAYVLGFLRIAINARLDEMIAQAHGGVGLQHITKGKLEALAIPLPPLAEQKRIVAKVEQLMDLCDDLEARQTKKRDTSTRLTKSALQALTTAEGPEEFDLAWKRVVDNFDVLIDRSEKVGELRKAIVDLASKGRLTARTGRTVSAVLDLRRQERRATWEAEQLAKFKRDGRQPRDHKWKAAYEEPPSPAADDLPALPAGWAYAPIGALGADPFCPVQTGPFGAQLHRSEFTTSGVPVIAVGNLTWNGFSADGIYFISAAKAEQLARYDVQSGDLLFARSGATLGKVCVAPPEAKDWRMTGHILRVRLDPRAIRSDLAVLWLWASEAVTEQVQSTIRGGTRPGYNTSLLESIVIPIPPLAEQNAIVAKVEQLMKVCDDLEARLLRAEDRASKLGKAVVQELVS